MSMEGHDDDYPNDDVFDRLPDQLLRVIFTSLADVKALIRCRAVSRRFHSLASQTPSLHLSVDRPVNSPSSSRPSAFLKSVLRSIHSLLLSPKKPPAPQNPPLQILRGFDTIRQLEIQLPAGDLRLEKGALVRWKAVFGKTLKTIVIVAMSGISECVGDVVVGEGEGEGNVGEGLKTRVVWTISALIAASSQHFLVKEVVKEHKEMRVLLVRDREGEGRLVMDEEGIRECREDEDLGGSGRRENNSKERTTVPAVRMRMWHQKSVEVDSEGGGPRRRGEGGMVVVVRPAEAAEFGDGAACYCCEEAAREDEELARGGFEGMYGEVVERLLKSRSYMLEMNSF